MLKHWHGSPWNSDSLTMARTRDIFAKRKVSNTSFIQAKSFLRQMSHKPNSRKKSFNLSNLFYHDSFTKRSAICKIKIRKIAVMHSLHVTV